MLLDKSFRVKYDLSDLGFLSNNKNIKFPIEYKYLRYLLNNINESDNYIIEYQLPNLNIYKYEIIKEIYTLCSLLTNKYSVLICNNNKKLEIPYIIGKPFYESSKLLGINMVLTHSSVDLWNWNLINNKEKFSLENIQSKYLMSKNTKENETENWFYMIMTGIEGECGNMIFNMNNIYNYIDNDNKLKKNDFTNIYNNLQIILDKLEKQIEIINRIYDNCNPYIFYYNIRKYLWGSDKYEKGLIIKDFNCEEIKFRGGTAAQSCLIHAQDIFFNIIHNDEFLMEMKSYMSKKHRNLLSYFSNKKNLLTYLDSIKNTYNNEEYEIIKLIQNLYNNCINKILKFRKSHYNIVNKYVIQFDKKKEKIKGTGGTDLEVFLNKIILNTRDILLLNNNRNNNNRNNNNRNNNRNNNNRNKIRENTEKINKEKYFYLWRFIFVCIIYLGVLIYVYKFHNKDFLNF